MVDGRRAVGVVGAVATLVGAVAVLRPELVTAIGPFATLVEGLGASSARTLLLSGGVVVGLSLVRWLWTSSADRTLAGDPKPAERFERALADPPETATADRWELTASDLDSEIRRGVAGDTAADDRVRQRLVDVAVDRLARETDATREAAQRAVAEGSWTDDRTAAALLSDAEGPVHSRRSRLRRWLDPATERRRRLRRTVTALKRLPAAGGPTDADPERAGEHGGDGGDER